MFSESVRWTFTIVQVIGVIFLVLGFPLIGCALCLGPSIYFMVYLFNQKDRPLGWLQLVYVLTNILGIGVAIA